jgi:large subunit ribosomal protein L29
MRWHEALPVISCQLPVNATGSRWQLATGNQQLATVMKMKEILEKETEHLRQELTEKQKHMFHLRSQAVTEKLEDPTQLGKTRKEIARIKTVIRQRQLKEQTTQAKA